MKAQFALHLIPLLPLLGAAFALIFGRYVSRGVVTLVTLGAVLGAALVAGVAVFHLHHEVSPGGSLVDTFFDAPWIAADNLKLSAGLELDHLSAVLLLIITGIGFLIHVYASAYMEHDDG